jgi:hypothetical protein
LKNPVTMVATGKSTTLKNPVTMVATGKSTKQTLEQTTDHNLFCPILTRNVPESQTVGTALSLCTARSCYLWHPHYCN